MSKEAKPESKERNIRRHEVSFSKIQGNHSSEYVDNYLYHHGQFEEPRNWRNEEFESNLI